MNLIQNPTIPSAAESHVARTAQIANQALLNLKSECVETFRRLWYSDISPQDQLAVMGTNAVAAFTQHANTIMFLLQSGIGMNPADYTPPLAYTAHEDGTITINQEE